MKRMLTGGMIIFMVLLTYLVIYINWLHPGAKNYRAFKELEIGMTEKEVLQLMGNPDYTLECDSVNKVVTCYIRPGYYLSDDIKVVINRNSDEVVNLIGPR